MSNRKYYIINTEKDDIEYILEEVNNESTLILSHSQSPSWSSHVRGEEVVRCIDTGNGIKFIWKDKISRMHFDYTQVHQMNILTNFMNMDYRSPHRYDILSTNSYISV